MENSANVVYDDAIPYEKSGCSVADVRKLMAFANMGTISNSAYHRLANSMVHPVIQEAYDRTMDANRVAVAKASPRAKFGAPGIILPPVLGGHRTGHGYTCCHVQVHRLDSTKTGGQRPPGRRVRSGATCCMHPER